MLGFSQNIEAYLYQISKGSSPSLTLNADSNCLKDTIENFHLCETLISIQMLIMYNRTGLENMPVFAYA